VKTDGQDQWGLKALKAIKETRETVVMTDGMAGPEIKENRGKTVKMENLAL
jgi:hypothetical protein